MNITVEDVAPCKKRLKIEVPATRVQEAYEKVANDFQKEVRIPGFRPGHAPRTVVLKKFQKEIEKETKRKLVPEIYDEAIKEKQLRPLTQPDIEDVNYQPGVSLTFSSVVELVPDFDLPEYRGLVLPKLETEVTDDEVDAVLSRLADQQAKFEDAPERPLEMGDYGVIRYSGTVEGTPILEIAPEAKFVAKHDDFWLWMKDGTFLPNFVEQCIGLAKGETRTVAIEFPEDFHVKDLIGKKAVYVVELKEIKVKTAPTIDDAFAHSLAPDVTLEQIKKNIRASMEGDKKAKTDRELRSKLVEKLNALVDFPLPPTPVEEEPPPNSGLSSAPRPPMPLQ